MNGLSCGEESMTNMFSRFDTIPACERQTDGWPIAKTCFSIANARKNQQKVLNCHVRNGHTVFINFLLKFLFFLPVWF